MHVCHQLISGNSLQLKQYGHSDIGVGLFTIGGLTKLNHSIDEGS